jgi:hypothetical protein
VRVAPSLLRRTGQPAGHVDRTLHVQQVVQASGTAMSSLSRRSRSAMMSISVIRLYGMGDLCRSYLKARGSRRLLVPVRMPGKAGRAYRAGENLALDGVDRGHRTWEEFLADRIAA